MLVLPSQTRISQPQSVASIDWSNPITKGLVFAFNAGSGLCDLVSGKTLTTSGSVVRQVDSNGTSIYTAASADVAYCTLAQSIPTTFSVSVFELSKVNNTTTTRKRSVRLSGTLGLVLNHDYSDGATAIDLVGIQDNLSQFPATSFPSYVANKFYSSYFSHTAGSQYPVFVRDGVTATVNANVGNGTRKEAITQIYLGNNLSGAPMQGSEYLCLVFNRVLQVAERNSLRQNPWQIFQPDRRAIFLPATSVTLSYLRPSADISTGSWTPSAGTTLYETLDEVSASDADYIQTSTASSCEVRLAAGATPSNRDNHTIRYRILAGTGTLTAVLKCGSTTIKSWNHTLTGSAQDISNALTNAEASTIADYSDLRVTFTGS